MGAALLRRRVTAAEYRVLHELADSPTGTAERARIILSVLDGTRPATLARRLGLPRTTVYSWVRRFVAVGVNGLENHPRGGSAARHEREDGRCHPASRRPVR